MEQDILKGMYLLKAGGKGDKKVQLMGSGTILQEVIAGAELLKADFGVEADIWSCPSFKLAAPRCHRSRTFQPPASVGS